jgi:hypothetical protein
MNRLIFKIQRFFAKENCGCENCKWFKAQTEKEKKSYREYIHNAIFPIQWTFNFGNGDKCRHKNNLITRIDVKTGETEIKDYVKNKFEDLNEGLKCPWFKSKVDPSLYGNGKMQEDLKRAFVFSEPKKSQKKGKKK